MGYIDTFIDMDPDQYTEADCPNCGGVAVELGVLGRLAHFRCRQCGTDFSVTITIQGKDHNGTGQR